MALSFPLQPADFFGGLRVKRVTFDLPEALEMSRTGDGAVLTADLGDRLWSGKITLVPARHADAAAISARLKVLREAGRSFLVYDTVKAYPAADPDGSILGAVVPQVASLPAGNRTLTLQGLPSGYVISDGDYLSFEYASNPVRTALHQVVVGAQADGLGVTPEIEVTPHIRPGATVGTQVTLVRAYCRAVIVPGSVTPPSAEPGRVSSGASFSFVQTLR